MVWYARYLLDARSKIRTTLFEVMGLAEAERLKRPENLWHDCIKTCENFDPVGCSLRDAPAVRITRSMSFDERHHRRQIILDRVMLASQVLAVFYMAIHLMIVWESFNERGALAALATFITLGFGDAYWTVHWLQFEGASGRMMVAGLAAIVCFTSWLTRPMFNRWINSFTIDMVKDFTDEIDQTLKEISATESDTASADHADPAQQKDDDANDQPRPR
jgi:hypothetical protein